MSSPWPLTPGLLATPNRRGAMPADAYASYAGVAPTDPTSDISTTGASGSYSEATVTGLTSSIDSSVTTLAYDRCHDTGHAGTAKLIPTILYPGFDQTKAQFTQAMKRRLAAYVDPDSGRAPLVIAVSPRSPRDYCRDTQDRFDCLDHAVAAVGASNVYGGGNGAILIGYSTGCFDAMLAACRCPDKVFAVILYFPNFDLGVDPNDSYWGIQNPGSTTRTSMTTSIGDRAQGSATALDPYLARNPIDGLARIMSLPGGPHVWVLGDRTEAPTAGIPNPDRLVSALLGLRESAAKTHAHVTQTGDSNRILHDSGVDGTGAVYAERYFWPFVLKNSAEWLVPRRSPRGDLRIFGWMKTRGYTSASNPALNRPGFEIWTGASNPPRTSAAGGRLHAAEFKYLEAARQFTVDPSVTSQNGYAQVVYDGDNRIYALTAGTPIQANLNISPTVSSLSSLGYAHEWLANLGVTESGGNVSAWADQIGALSFTEGTNKPTVTTDGDGKSLIRFASASSQKLLMNSLLVDPTQDFTICMVVNKTNATAQNFFEVSHHGSLAVCNIAFNSGVTAANYRVDSGSYGFANTNGIGGQVFSQNAKHLLVLMRKSSVYYMSIDGSPFSSSPVTADTFTLTGTNTSTIGAGWANSGGAYWQFLNGDVYHLASKNAASSQAEVQGILTYVKTLWTF